MNNNQKQFKKWIGPDDPCDYEKEMGWLGGWVKEDTGWEAYIERMGEKELGCRPYLESLKEEIVKNNIQISGEQHQHGEKGIPLFEDGVWLELSFNAWGDLMGAIWGTDHISYYM